MGRHPAACGDGANTGSHPAHWGCSGAGERARAWSPLHVAPEWLHCPGTGTRDTSAPPGVAQGWSAGADTSIGVSTGAARHQDGTGAGTAPSIPPHAELWAGAGSSALIAAAQPADLALNPSACHRLCSSQHRAGGGDKGTVPAAVCAVPCQTLVPAVPQRSVLCQTPARSKRQEGPP